MKWTAALILSFVKDNYVKTAALTLALAVTVGWLGDSIKGDALFCYGNVWGWIGGCESTAAWLLQMAFCSALVTGFLILGRNTFSRLGGVASLRQVGAQPSKVMVALLSDSSHKSLTVQPEALVLTLKKQPAPIRLPMPMEIKDLNSELKSRDLFWNWTMLLTAIEYHRSQLEVLALVGTKESLSQVNDFKLLLQVLMGDAAPLVKSTEPVDFIDLESVRSRVVETMTELHEHHGVPYESMTVNVTGGTKTASIASAIAAMDKEARLEYVDGNEEPRRTMTYMIDAVRWSTG